jgi:RNA polymerase sigma factor (sigma-70 family)
MTSAPPMPFADFLQPPPEDDFLGLASRFVDWFLRRWPGLSSHAEDLRQEAAIGAMLAAKKFDPSRNVSFVVYAWWRMRGQVTRYLRSAFDRPKMLRELAASVPSPLSRTDAVQLPCDAATVIALLRPVLEEATRPIRKRMYPRKLGASARRDVELFLAVLKGESMAEAGRRFGISRERARQLVERLTPAFNYWRATLG